MPVASHRHADTSIEIAPQPPTSQIVIDTPIWLATPLRSFPTETIKISQVPYSSTCLRSNRRGALTPCCMSCSRQRAQRPRSCIHRWMGICTAVADLQPRRRLCSSGTITLCIVHDTTIPCEWRRTCQAQEPDGVPYIEEQSRLRK